MAASSKHGTEVASGDRFEFGANWSRFLDVLTDERVGQADASLRDALGVETLSGKTFLDVGSGSGMFSLAARRLGANVFSFDYDPESVACTLELRRRYFPDDSAWTVQEGSVLDDAYLQRLGRFDVVYSWGVLHHTGAMWQALGNVAKLVAPGGRLFIAIYNDQGGGSRRWRVLKRTYNRLPWALRTPFALATMAPREVRALAVATLRGQPLSYFRTIANYSHVSTRGMSYWHDVLDWIGGYPFEVAKPEQIFAHFRERGFTLEKLRTCGGSIGCNEYIFLRPGDSTLDRHLPVAAAG